MKICTLYGTTLRVHPMFPVLLVFYMMAGHGLLIAAYLAALLLHEAGHWYAAGRLRLSVAQIELTPFGGVMQIGQGNAVTGPGGFRLACAGVLVNLIFFLLSACLLRRSVSPFLLYFALAHLSMMLINLLPVLPLDGGRMLLSLLSLRFPPERIWRPLLIAGRVLCALLMVYSLVLALCGIFRPFWMILGCYLLYASVQEEKQSTARYIAALFSRRYRADSGAALPVQHICVGGDMPLYLLLPQLDPRAYHMVSVLDDSARCITGTITETQLYQALLEQPEAQIKTLTQKAPAARGAGAK